jgi:hypothetical protein
MTAVHTDKFAAPSTVGSAVLPTFLIIGAPKAGTTSLHHYLAQHPKICMSEPKETDFFLRADYRTALSEYAQCFAHDTTSHVRGEASPRYTWYPFLTDDIPGRIASVVPEAKLIYLVRDPVERAIGFYWEMLTSRDLAPLEEAFADPYEDASPYVCPSRYAVQLERYLRWFPRSQMLVLDSEDLRLNRRATLQTVFEFVGVEDYWSPAFDSELNGADTKVKPSRLGRRLRRSLAADIVRRTLPTAARERVFAPIRAATSAPVVRRPLPEDLRARLEDALASDAARFRELVGQTYEHWSV